MSASSPRALSSRPNLDWYRKAAKKKLRDLRQSNPAYKLADAQLDLARELQFSSWRALKQQIDQTTGSRLGEVATLFLRFAEQECKGSSPLYEMLSRKIALDPNLLAIASLGKTPIPNLFLAAIHWLLMQSPMEPLANAYASIRPKGEGDRGTFSLFSAFCERHRADIIRIMRERTVQTNEVARCGYLRPAFAVAAQRLGGKPLALVEIGASAGLNLCLDRYGYDYGDGTPRGKSDSAVQVKVELRGAVKPPVADEARIERRIGLDLHPIRANDVDAIGWLEALVWPEHEDRRKRLKDAIAIAAASRIEWESGDANDHLEWAINSVEPHLTPCVFQTHTLNQFSAAARDNLLKTIQSLGIKRDLAFVSRHDRLTLETYVGGKHEQQVLAECDGHGRWIEWKLAAEPAMNAGMDADLVKQFSDAFARDRGDVDAIRVLLDAHPELVHCQPWAPNWPHSAIEAAAHQATWHRPKMVEIAKLLIERGAVADLGTVARAGLVDEVKKRLDADPSLVNQPDAKGRTPIYRAACLYAFLKESIPVVEELIRRGATIDIFSAASWLMLERLEPMLRANPALARAKDPEGLTALHWVTRTDPDDKRQTEAARLLLDAGADPSVEAAGQNGMRPLHCAAEWPSSIELAGLLIDRGADINAASSQSPWTPLDYATDRNRPQMRDHLRSRGGRTREELAAIPDAAVDTFLKTVNSGEVATVGAELDERPDLINRTAAHPRWSGRPQALHVAIERGDQPMFDLLLSRGANPFGDNALYDHWSPLMLAIHWKREGMRDELFKRVPVSLIDALMMSDDKAALKFLESGAITFQRSMPNDASMLHFARTRASAARLLELGNPIDGKDKYGKTPLDVAAENGAADMVNLLIERGASASVKTFARLGDLNRVKKLATRKDINRPLLVAAIQSKNEKLVRWVISQGADVNEPNERGAIPLHDAAFEGNLPIVKLLVKAGANVHTEDSEYSATPSNWAHHAAENLKRLECAEVVAYLEEQMAKKKWSADQLPERRKNHKIVQWKPIMDAAFVGDSAEIKKLVKQGADPNITSTTPGAHRPLHRAIEHKKTAPRTVAHEKAVQTLLDLGADPHLRGAWDRHTALQLAATESPRFVPLLLEHFKPLDFFHACAVLDEKRVAALLKKDPKLVEARETNGYTGLHYVAGSRLYQLSDKHLKTQLAIAKMLIDAGAEVNASYIWLGGGDWPISVLFFACGRNDNPQLTELLMKAGAQPYDNESVYHASDEGHDASLAVIEKYADKAKLAEEATLCLRTQMHWGKSRGAKWLLEHGADPTSLHPQCGNAALHSAAKYGANEKVIALFLTHGADPKQKNADGLTPLQVAKKAGKTRVVKQLEAVGKRKR